ncbi:MAG: metallophosphoesterase [Candidatus Aminicenantales bacterium]
MRPSNHRIKKLAFLSLSLLILITPLFSSKIQCEWSGVEKIVAVGDLHGDYNNFVKILKKASIVDENLSWTGGKTHLVQTGDIMDRGPDAKKIFDLIMRLEREAEEAGGKVHMLIGNHEELNITGIALDYRGYVTPRQLTSFLPLQYREKLEKKRKKDESVDDFWWRIINKEREARGTVGMRYTNEFNDRYGKWIIEHNAAIKINDTVFVHGGISKKYSSMGLEKINEKLRKELEDFRLSLRRFGKYTGRPSIIYDTEGPLWYRKLALESGEQVEQEIDQILKNIGAKHIVIAHTPRMGSPIYSKELMSKFGGKVWIIDTSISDYVGGGFPSALVINKGNFSILLDLEEETEYLKDKEGNNNERVGTKSGYSSEKIVQLP